MRGARFTLYGAPYCGTVAVEAAPKPADVVRRVDADPRLVALFKARLLRDD